MVQKSTVTHLYYVLPQVKCSVVNNSFVMVYEARAVKWRSGAAIDTIAVLSVINAYESVRMSKQVAEGRVGPALMCMTPW